MEATSTPSVAGSSRTHQANSRAWRSSCNPQQTFRLLHQTTQIQVQGMQSLTVPLTSTLPPPSMRCKSASVVGEIKPYTSVPPQLYGLCRAGATSVPGSPWDKEPATWKWTSGGSQLTTKPLVAVPPAVYTDKLEQSDQWQSHQCEKHTSLLSRGRVGNHPDTSFLHPASMGQVPGFGTWRAMGRHRGRHHFLKTTAGSA